MNIRRRQLILVPPVAVLAACGTGMTQVKQVTAAALFCGQIDDGGFMQAGYQGLVLARDQISARTSYIDKVPNETEAQVSALRKLAASNPTIVIAHGGQNNMAAERVASEYPRIMFVVTQGSVRGENLASYDVLQEESAWLAGAYAALMSRSGVVAHQSGIRVPPGLRGRAAYADGVRTANPKVRLLTNFSGNQDDVALAARVTRAQAHAGADIIFTMLNAGRSGTTQACRELGIHEIGNVSDWVERDPGVFIASAWADVGIGIYQAINDVAKGLFKTGAVKKLGLQSRDAVRLIMSKQTPQDVAGRINQYEEDILSGTIKVRTTYDGPEFSL